MVPKEIHYTVQQRVLHCPTCRTLVIIDTGKTVWCDKCNKWMGTVAIEKEPVAGEYKLRRW